MSSTSGVRMKKMQERLLHLTLRSMRILNNGNRKFIYAKNWPFFAPSCSRVRNENTREERFRGVIEGGKIQSLSESHYLWKGSRQENRLATAAAFSKEPLEFWLPLCYRDIGYYMSHLVPFSFWWVRQPSRSSSNYTHLMMMPSLIEAPLGRVHSSILWALIPLSIRYEMYDVSVHNSKSTAKLVFIYKSVCWPGVRWSLYP